MVRSSSAELFAWSLTAPNSTCKERDRTLAVLLCRLGPEFGHLFRVCPSDTNTRGLGEPVRKQCSCIADRHCYVVFAREVIETEYCCEWGWWTNLNIGAMCVHLVATLKAGKVHG